MSGNNYGNKKYKRGHSRNDFKEKQARQEEKRKMIGSIKNLIKNSHLNRAIVEINKYLELYPNDSYGLFQKASILMNLNDIYGAESIHKQIVDNDLESKYSSLYKLGEISLIRGNKKDAEKYFRRNIETSPYAEIFSRTSLATLELEKGNKENAAILLDGFYDKTDSQELLEDIYVRFNQISSDPYSKNVLYLERATFKIGVDDIAEARRNMKLINLEIADDYFKRKYNLIMGIIEKKDYNYDTSLNYLLEASKGAKNNGIYFEAQVQIAQLKLNVEQSEEAIEFCDKIIDDIDALGTPVNNRFNIKILAKKIKANAYKELRNYEEAERIFIEINSEIMEQTGHDSPDIYYDLGKMEFEKQNYDLAIQYLEKCHFDNSENKKIQKKNFFRMLSLLKTKQYEEAYQLCIKIKKKFLGKTFQREHFSILLYLKYKTNRNVEQTKQRYLYSQITNYSLENAIDHINAVHTKVNGITSRFNKDVDIEALCCSLPDLLKADGVVLTQNFFLETYLIPYNDIGYVNGKPVDTLRVVLLPNSFQVITMFPYGENSNQKTNYFNTEKFTGKVKRKSQIEKFYSRYGKK